MKRVSLSELFTYFHNMIDEKNIFELQSSVGQELVNISMDAFDAQEDPETKEPWTPLSQTTVKNRNINKILFLTGNLMSSIDYEIEGDTVFVGTNIEYGLYHQKGIKKADGSELIPARPFLGIDENFKDFIEEEMEAIFDL